MQTDKLVAQAVAELGINVPVLRVEPHGDGLRLWLYGGQGEPVIWGPAKVEVEAKAETETKPKPKAKARPKPKKESTKK